MEVRNRFKGLRLIECLMNYGWRFVTLYRRQGSRTFPWKRIVKKAKWLSEEALQIAMKRREVKSKREKERYKHLNAEFQRIERRNKKAFLSDQCKEIDSMVLAQRQNYRSMEQNRKPRDKSTHLWTPYL